MDRELPTPEDIQIDLQRIAHSLDSFWNLPLKALAALPTIRAWRQPPKTAAITSEGERRAHAIEELITELIPQQPYQEDRDALAALFTFGDQQKTVKERHADAGKARGKNAKGEDVSGNSFRVTHEPKILHKLAIDIYRAQLSWCMTQVDLGRSTVHTGSHAIWWTTVEKRWTVAIEESDPTIALWEFSEVVRCVAPVAQPILVITIKWTGGGLRRVSEVEVLSGPKPGDTDAEFPHKLLGLRSASPSPVADTAYIWDLGNPLLAGDEVEVAWRHPLKADTELPFMGISTAYKPDLRAIGLRAQIPESITEQPRAEEHAEHSTSSSSYAAPWVKLLKTSPLKMDDEGYYTYVPDPVTIGHRYELWWGARPTSNDKA